MDAVTGRMSGVEIMVCVYQCHIRASAGREGVKSVGLDIMISPGVCSASPYSCSFRHNYIQTALSVESISSRIGVFVDHSAGTLSFYSVSDTMSPIHTIQTTFTQLLYAGFTVHKGSSVKLTKCVDESE